MQTNKKCTFCDGTASLIEDIILSEYKGEIHSIIQYFYKCDTCKDEFTTNEVDEKTIRQHEFLFWKNHVSSEVSIESVLTDLDKVKTMEEYSYMFEHIEIYNESEFKLIVDTFLENKILEKYPILTESYENATRWS